MDEIEELRTRVADQEKALSDGILGIEYWKQQAEHFTARCAEQGSKISELSIYSDAMEKELRGKNEELQTRLSTLKEKHDCLKHNYRILDEKREIGIDYATKEIDRLTIRLSTLEKEAGKVTGETSDGYHTFNELYDHRVLLWINLCLANKRDCYVVEEHYPCWFLLGMKTKFGQISYHCPNKFLHLVVSINRERPEFDGHTSKDVIDRLERMAVDNPSKLSTLEQSILDLSHPNIKNILSELNQYKFKTVNVVAFHKLEDRLSTLLKASEGMEKALEMLYSELVESNSPRCDEWSTPAKIIKQALADFRALKEAK